QVFSSSNRRHTSYASDWSSDVCSSDLISQSGTQNGTWSWNQSGLDEGNYTITITATNADSSVTTTSFTVHVTDKAPSVAADNASVSARSEERRVGKGRCSGYEAAVNITSSAGTISQSGAQSG